MPIKEYPENYFAIKHAEVQLTLNGKQRCLSLAALILKAFVGEAPSGCPLARHLNDNRENNHLANLAWGSYSDNLYDAIRNGRKYFGNEYLNRAGKQKGEKNHNAKLNTLQVASIRREFTGNRGDKAKLARKYNISHSAICEIIAGTKWASIL